jgi:hypothetical protein
MFYSREKLELDERSVGELEQRVEVLNDVPDIGLARPYLCSLLVALASVRKIVLESEHGNGKVNIEMRVEV